LFIKLDGFIQLVAKKCFLGQHPHHNICEFEMNSLNKMADLDLIPSKGQSRPIQTALNPGTTITWK